MGMRSIALGFLRQKWISTLAGCFLFLAGCSTPMRISAADFKREYAMVGQPQTMRSVTYLGVREGRALLKIGSLPVLGGKWKERIVYVPVEELDPAFRRTLPPGT